MAGKEFLPRFESEVETSTASQKHRELVKQFGGYALETFGGEIKNIHAEYKVGGLLADVYIEKADGKEVVEVDTKMEKYVRLKVLTDDDEGVKLEQLEKDGHIVNGNESVERTPDGFYFVPRGNMREVERELHSRGWKVEPSYRMNRLVEKFNNMGRAAERFSVLVSYRNLENLETFLGELERCGPPVYRVYTHSESDSKVTGFIEMNGGGDKTCQK